MLIKVCGMRDAANIAEVQLLDIDMMGFICYPPSPRYVDTPLPDTGTGRARVGVFVNAAWEQIVETAVNQRFTHIQLHGTESLELCMALRALDFRVIKALPIAKAEDFQLAAVYDGRVDMLLFDTRCEAYGGSGRQFDWSLLDYYRGETPFLLSGGITPDEVDSLRSISHPRFAGIDLNSGFEIAPALKDSQKLNQFIKAIRQ